MGVSTDVIEHYLQPEVHHLPGSPGNRPLVAFALLAVFMYLDAVGSGNRSRN